MEELYNYKLYITVFGSIVNLTFFVIKSVNLEELDKTNLSFKKILFLFLCYIIVGVFSYIFFYEDIQVGENKIAITIGFSSYYFLQKLFTQISQSYSAGNLKAT